MASRTLDPVILQTATRGSDTNLIRDGLLEMIQAAVTALQAAKQVSQNDSFGLVICSPYHAGAYIEVWDSPELLLDGGLAIGWGPDWEEYAFNGLRKCRATARTLLDSHEIVERQRLAPSLFLDPVPSKSDDPENPYLWGDFPHGGAVLLGEGWDQVLAGVSGLTAREDDAVAHFAIKLYIMLLDQMSEAD